MVVELQLLGRFEDPGWCVDEVAEGARKVQGVPESRERGGSGSGYSMGYGHIPVRDFVQLFRGEGRANRRIRSAVLGATQDDIAERPLKR